MELDEVEVSFVDDETIADLHLQYMQIPGPTDVITFAHGEIHISVETAKAQASEYANDFERELMLYIVHGCCIWRAMMMLPSARVMHGGVAKLYSCKGVVARCLLSLTR